jgi:precorrin-2 dehydrogenase / sirohydrochlorin ferrochelatase
MRMKKNFLPIAIDISGEKILIVGGDQGAVKKLNILQRFGAEVEVLAKYVCPEIKQSGIVYYEREYHSDCLQNYLMVYSCTNNETLDLRIAEDGRAAGVLINIHDKPSLCRFISPAIYRNGNISVAVSSNGEDVYESIRLRNFIQDYLQSSNI